MSSLVDDRVGPVRATGDQSGGSSCPPIIEVRDLGIEFRVNGQWIRAVDGVSLDVSSGETVALVGESGSGKSVTSLAIMGLLPEGQARRSGEIRFVRPSGVAEDLQSLSRSAMTEVRGNEIAMIFQEPMTSLNPLQTIGAQIRESLLIHRKAKGRSADQTVLTMLERVGISEPARRSKSYPHELSGGMRQRVMIAMALICGPRLIIADEPTTALDVTIQAQIMEVFRDLRDRMHQSMLFITHDLGVVAEIANRLFVMYAGQVVESGPTKSIFKSPLHPYTAGLIASSPRVDRQRRSDGPMYAIPGRTPELGRMPPGCRFAPRCSFAQVGRCDGAVPPLETAQHAHAVRCVRWNEIASARHA